MTPRILFLALLLGAGAGRSGDAGEGAEDSGGEPTIDAPGEALAADKPRTRVRANFLSFGTG